MEAAGAQGIQRGSVLPAQEGAAIKLRRITLAINREYQKILAKKKAKEQQQQRAIAEKKAHTALRDAIVASAKEHKRLRSEAERHTSKGRNSPRKKVMVVRRRDGQETVLRTSQIKQKAKPSSK